MIDGRDAGRSGYRLRDMAAPRAPASSSAASRASIHAESVGTCLSAPPMPGPPWSTIVPLAARSSSPRLPSVIENVMTAPANVAGSMYQLGVGLPGVGPYFQ